MKSYQEQNTNFTIMNQIERGKGLFSNNKVNSGQQNLRQFQSQMGWEPKTKKKDCVVIKSNANLQRTMESLDQSKIELAQNSNFFIQNSLLDKLKIIAQNNLQNKPMEIQITKSIFKRPTIKTNIVYYCSEYDFRELKPNQAFCIDLVDVRSVYFTKDLVNKMSQQPFYEKQQLSQE